jgi:O-antigen ligase
MTFLEFFIAMRTQTHLNKIKTPVLSFFFLALFYVSLVRGLDPTLFMFYLSAFALLHLKWPNEALLLLAPGLFPTVSLDFGFGISPFRVIVVATLLRQILKGQWSIRTLRQINPLILYGWFILISAFLVSNLANYRDNWSDVFIWLVRCGLMLSYISAWLFCRNPEYGFWGWLIGGLLTVPAAIYAYSTTGDVLTVRINSQIIGQGSPLSVSILILAVSGFVVVSFWSCLALQSRQMVPDWFVPFCGSILALPWIMSGRRQAVLAMLLSLLCCLFIASRHMVWRILIPVVLAVCFLINTGMFREFMEGRESINDELEGGGSNRYQVYKAGIEGFLEKPILGWGLASYKELTQTRGIIASETGEGISSHNTIIGVAAETGIVGLLGLLCIIIGCFRESLKLLTLDRQMGVGPWTYTFPVLGYVIAGILVSALIEGHGYLLSLAILCGAAGRYTPKARS